jgi:hypothetical protein
LDDVNPKKMKIQKEEGNKGIREIQRKTLHHISKEDVNLKL